MSMASATGQARQASNSKGMDAVARLGLAARGTIYLLIGILAVLLAVGHKSGESDQRGAMQQLSRQTGGFVLLLVVALGLAGYALWRLSEAAFGVAGEGKKTGPRLQSLGRGLVYVFLAVSAFVVLSRASRRARPSSSSRSPPGSCTTPPDGGLVGLVGVVVVVIGAVLVREGVTKKFEKYFKLGEMSPGARKATEFLGTVGTTARGIVFAITGVLLVVAAVQFDPKKARGIDGALLALRDTTFGPVLLVIVALGLIMFGLFGFCEARWRRT